MGRAGRIHLRCLRVREDVHIKYLIDPLLPQDLDIPPGARVVRSVDEVTSDDSVDFVICATPTPSHAAVTLAALKAKMGLDQASTS